MGLTQAIMSFDKLRTDGNKWPFMVSLPNYERSYLWMSKQAF